MLHINSIQDFFSLSSLQQHEILKALKTKERLEEWLKSLNGKKKKLPVVSDYPGWKTCKSCEGHPGWVEADQGRDDSDIHPSQIHKCVRMLWYSCNGYAEQLDEYVSPQLRMIFDMGHAWHHTIQTYGRKGAWGDCGYIDEIEIDPDKMNIDGSPQLPLASHYWIKGHADAVLTHYYVPNVPLVGDLTIKLVHEYKTISTDGYEKLNRPKPEHKWQAMIYAAVFDAPIVVYLYTNKNNCQMAEFPVPFDMSIWKSVEQKIKIVQEWTDKKQPPDFSLSAATTNPYECKDCGYKKICNPPIKKR